MNDSTGGKFVNTFLSCGLLSELEHLKVYHGIQSSSDLIRLLIRQETRRLNVTAATDLNTSDNQHDITNQRSQR